MHNDLQTTTTSSTSTRLLPEAWVEQLFQHWLLDYGKKFTDQWGASDLDTLIKHWSTQLAGYRGAELDRGVAAVATRDRPPTLPEFKRLCRPGVDLVSAYHEAVLGVQARFTGENGTWSHPAIYWAAMPLAVELREQPYNFIRARWEAALEQQLASSSWPPIPNAMAALPAPGKTRTSREEASRRLQQLGAQTIVHDAAGRDARRWARKLLEREAAGEALLPLPARWAHEVLDARPEA